MMDLVRKSSKGELIIRIKFNGLIFLTEGESVMMRVGIDKLRNDDDVRQRA